MSIFAGMNSLGCLWLLAGFWFFGRCQSWNLDCWVVICMCWLPFGRSLRQGSQLSMGVPASSLGSRELEHLTDAGRVSKLTS